MAAAATLAAPPPAHADAAAQRTAAMPTSSSRAASTLAPTLGANATGHANGNHKCFSATEVEARSSEADASRDGSVVDGLPAGLRFCSLVRDTIASVPQTLAPAEYVRKQVQIQAEASGMVSSLPRGTALVQYVRSVLLFLSTPSGGAESATPAGPTEALLEFDEVTQSYRWVAAQEQCSDEKLLQLEALHYERFLAQHGGLLGCGGNKGLHAAPSKSQKAALTLPEGSAAQLALFHKQETERFANPDRPFTYTLRDGSSSTVAAIGKRSMGGKAREHFLLSAERPPTATLLALVRDAAARLPGGEGSRADVCELLKESQYVMEGVNDAQISQVASGALDRLHYEDDPCVRYDPERKMWVYLHGQRSEDDYSKFAAAAGGKRPKLNA